MIKGKLFVWGIRFCFSILPALIALSLLFAVFTESNKTKTILATSQNEQITLTPVSETSNLYFAYVYAHYDASTELMPVLVPSKDRRKLLGDKIQVFPTYNEETPYVLSSMLDDYKGAWSIAGLYITPFSMILFFWFLLLGLWTISFEYNVRNDEEDFNNTNWTDNPKMRALVERLEIEADNSPQLYALKVKMLGLFGIVAIPFTLLFFTGFAAWIVALSIGESNLFIVTLKFVLLPLIVFNYTVFKALGGPRTEAAGIKVTKEDCPKLFEAIEEVRNKLSAPKIHHVYIDDEFNASLSQKSRTRIFWWPETTLTLGTPLLQSLSTEETKAIIAHELGHLIKGDGANGAWTYYLRSSWDNLLNHDDDDWGVGWTFIKVFIQNFVPYFQAYSYVQSRKQEIIADQAAVYVVGTEITQSALNRVFNEGRIYDEYFWRDIFIEANTSTEPKQSPYITVKSYFTDQADNIRNEALSHSRERTADLTDTHPSPMERLAIIGGKLELPTKINDNASALLGSFEKVIIDKLTDEWWETAKENWKERYEDWQNALTDRNELEEKTQKSIPSEEEALRLARLIQKIDGWDAAIPAFEQTIQWYPDNSQASLCAGWQRLENNDETGLQLLDNAIANDPEVLEEACRDAINYFNKHDRKEDAIKYLALIEQHQATAKAAEEEREEFNDDDQIEPHKMSPWQLAKVVETVRKVPEIKEAHLFRKTVQNLPDQPVYVLAFKGVSHMSLMQDLDPIEKLQDLWPEDIEAYLISIDIHMPKLSKKLPDDGSSLIFMRN